MPHLARIDAAPAQRSLRLSSHPERTGTEWPRNVFGVELLLPAVSFGARSNRVSDAPTAALARLDRAAWSIGDGPAERSAARLAHQSGGLRGAIAEWADTKR